MHKKKMCLLPSQFFPPSLPSDIPSLQDLQERFLPIALSEHPMYPDCPPLWQVQRIHKTGNSPFHFNPTFGQKTINITYWEITGFISILKVLLAWARPHGLKMR